MIFASLILLAQTIPAPPPDYVLDQPCSVEKCPWQKDPIVSTTKLGPGPYTLVILNGGQAATRINYDSGAVCQRARDEFLQQFIEQHPGLVATGVTVACIPR